MSGETSVAPRGLQAPVFDHNGTGTRSNRFSLWESALGSYLGSLYGQLGVVALLKPDLEQAPFYGLRTRIKDATDDIIEGKDFLYKIKQAKVFPEIFIQLLSSGLQSGSLLEMFEKLAFYFKDEIDNSRSSLLSIIEPLILIIMGGIITLIILAILLPIMQMNNSFLS